MKKIAVASLSLLLVGCASMNNQDVGTISGGVIGGLIGSQFGVAQQLNWLQQQGEL